MKVGVLDRAIISKEQIRALADLPPKEILQAHLLGSSEIAAAKAGNVAQRACHLSGAFIESKNREGGRTGEILSPGNR